MPKYQCGDAFRLMRYDGRAADGTEIQEWIWNSRDGVTPFVVHAKNGKTKLQHRVWSLDRCLPNHVPALGDRVFVNMTPERARPIAEARVEQVSVRMPEFKPQSPEERVELVNDLIVSLVGDGDEPDIIEVIIEVDQDFLAKLSGAS